MFITGVIETKIAIQLIYEWNQAILLITKCKQRQYRTRRETGSVVGSALIKLLLIGNYVVRWDNNGVGMGGKDAGPGTEAKEGLGKGKEYPNPEFFKYDNYSYFDIEKQVVDSKKRVDQPQSGLTEFW